MTDQTLTQLYDICANKWSVGNRNTALNSYAKALSKRDDITAEEAADLVVAFNKEMSASLPVAEVENILEANSLPIAAETSND